MHVSKVCVDACISCTVYVYASLCICVYRRMCVCVRASTKVLKLFKIQSSQLTESFLDPLCVIVVFFFLSESKMLQN